MTISKPFQLQFYAKEKLISDCYNFYFQRTGQERDFIPGQYYEMKLPHKNMDERGDSRVFTISSSPTNKKFITITTRIIQSSFKMRLGSLKKGELVQFDGPWDDINFDEKDKSFHVFLAGGIGVTPYHSIIQYCIDKKIKTQMTLFVSWKNKDEIIFDDFFKNVQSRFDNFIYIPTLTEDQSLDIQNWDGEKGRIDEEMIAKYVPRLKENKYFISGPPAFVSSMKKILLSLDVLREKIISEEFEGYS